MINISHLPFGVMSWCCTHQLFFKYIFEIYLDIVCIAVGKNRKENMEGLKWFSSALS